MREKLRRLRKGTPDDWPSLALLEFTVSLAKAMAAKGMKQKDLAEALGVSPPYISSVMSGNENLTVEQMSRLAEAAGGSLHLTIAPHGLYVKWVEDALEDTTTEAATSPSVHVHEAALNTPMNSPPLPAPPLEMSREHRFSYDKPGSPDVSRPVHRIPTARDLACLPRRRPVNLLDQRGWLHQ